jgi:hypothetical protein
MPPSPEDDDAHEDELVPVSLPSGGTHWVYRREVTYFADLVRRYLADNAVTNISDLQDVDRIVVMETLCWRWGNWLSQRSDYWWDPIDEGDLSKQLKDASAELRNLKKALGIDKVTRDKERGENSISDYLANLRVRARQFGIMRETQLDKALELFNELTAKVTLCENTTDDEQRELHCSAEDVYAWIRDEAIPAYEAIDAHFRETQQRHWVRAM